MSVYYDILEYLNEMQIANVNKFFPFYVCSGGAHLFNRMNEVNKIICSHGLPLNMRGHVFFVAPQGFSKSFSMRVFAEKVYGLFNKTELNPGWEDRMTEARYSGTVYTSSSGEVKTEFGAAHQYRNRIMCVDEFDALAKAMQQEHSSTLESAICTSLDSGMIRKGLGRGVLEYKTALTMWAGSQPMRFDLGQGTGRRFIFLLFIPSDKDVEIIREAMRRGKNVKFNESKLENIKSGIDDVWSRLQFVNRVNFDDSLNKYYNNLNIMPYEEHLFNVIALGYTVMNKDFDGIINVTLDKELERLFKYEDDWRRRIKKGPETEQVLQIIKDRMTNGTDWISKMQVQERMADFGVDFKKSDVLIFQCQKEGRVERKTEPSNRGKREDCLRLIT